MSDEPLPTENDDDHDDHEERSAPTAPMNRNPLTRPTDHAVRPGFRSPANQRSKAIKGRKKGGSKKRR